MTTQEMEARVREVSRERDGWIKQCSLQVAHSETLRADVRALAEALRQISDELDDVPNRRAQRAQHDADDALARPGIRALLLDRPVARPPAYPPSLAAGRRPDAGCTAGLRSGPRGRSGTGHYRVTSSLRISRSTSSTRLP